MAPRMGWWKDSSGRSTDWLVTSLLGALLVWAPLPFASITRAGQAVVQVAALAILAATILTARSLEPLRLVALPCASIAAVGLLGLLQSLPLPGAIVSRLSPEHARLATETWSSLGIEAPMALSLAPGASRASALTWIAAAAAMAAASVAAADTQRRRLLAAALLGSAVLQVLFGTRHLYAGSPTMWGIVIAPATHLRGTFVNPDQSATYLLLGLSIAFGWCWLAVSRSRGASLEHVLLSVAPPCLIWITLFVALAFTGSRGGLIAAAFGSVVQGVLMGLRHRRWQTAPAAALAILLGLGAVGGIGLQQGLGKWMASTSRDASWGSRVQVYRLTLELWSRFPWTGTGLGTFRDAFPLVQPPDLDGAWWHAHSDPLEMLATTGVVGAILLLAGLFCLMLPLSATLRRAASREDRTAALVALGAIAAVGMHELVDFGLAMPATAISLAALCGAASVPVSANGTSRRS